MPAVVFRVAVLAQALAAGTFEPQRRRVEKRDRNSAEQRLAMAVERLLDSLGGVAARRVDRSEPGHRLVGMVEIEPFSARHAPPAEPVVSMAVGARDHQPVQHRQIDVALDINRGKSSTIRLTGANGALPRRSAHRSDPRPRPRRAGRAP